MSCHFLERFSELEDPRIERCRKHELLDIICRRNKTGKSNPSKVRRAGWNDDVRMQLLLGAGAPD